MKKIEIYFYKVGKIQILVQFLDFTRHCAEIGQLREMVSITRFVSRNREFGWTLKILLESGKWKWIM